MDGLARRACPPEPRAPQVAASPPVLQLVPLGDTWRVAYGSDVFTVRDSRGMRLLARLVERPREELHVLSLASDGDGALADSSAGPVLDEQARAAYRERLDDLAERLSEAEGCHDLGRVEALGAERDALLAELGRAFGLGGRARAAGSHAERARINVQRRLRDAIRRIAEVSPAIGALLAQAVRTGTYCSYRP
jgi:hypothetical protein